MVRRLLLQREIEAQTSARTIACGYCSAMEQHSMFHDCKAQASASLLSGTPLVHSVEPLKQTPQLLVLHTASVVLEADVAFRVVVFNQ